MIEQRQRPGRANDGRDDLALALARLLLRVERSCDDRIGPGVVSWGEHRDRFLERSHKLLRACDQEGLVVMRLLGSSQDHD